MVNNVIRLRYPMRERKIVDKLLVMEFGALLMQVKVHRSAYNSFNIQYN